MTAPLFVVYNLELATGDIDLCCYSPSHQEAEGALEEYATQWLAIITGVRNEDALDDDRQLEEISAGYHLRYNETGLDPLIDVYRVKSQGNFSVVRRFGLGHVNKWKEDYLDEVTPAVQALAADDTVAGVVYRGNRPGGRVDRFLKGQGNYLSDDEEET